MAGDLIPMVIVPGRNVRPYPESADNLLLAMIMDMAHTLFITDSTVRPEMEQLEAQEPETE